MKEYIVKADFITENDELVLPDIVSELIRCKDCKHWNTKDGQFKDFDGKEWHHCECFREFTDEDGDSPVTPSYFYCMNAERKEE